MIKLFQKYIQIDDWIFEIKEIVGRRVKSFGDPYDAIGTLKIVNGDVNTEGLLAKNGINKSDIKTLATLIKMLGHSEYITSTVKDGERIKRIVKI